MWPWKSESSKDRVTTHLPNEIALKMNDAEAKTLYLATNTNAMCLWVGGRGDRTEGYRVSGTETVASADLGSSSNYTNGNFVGRGGERFSVNHSGTLVSRS